jgi:hypothetical protein
MMGAEKPLKASKREFLDKLRKCVAPVPRNIEKIRKNERLMKIGKS